MRFFLSNILFQREQKRLNVGRMALHFGYTRVGQSPKNGATFQGVIGFAKLRRKMMNFTPSHPLRCPLAWENNRASERESRTKFIFEVNQVGEVMIIKSVKARHYFRKKRGEEVSRGGGEEIFWKTGSLGGRI